MCELLFFFYRQSLLLHHFQFPLCYLPSRCVIKLLVCGARTQKAPRHVLLVLTHFSDCRGRIHRSSVFGRRRFFRETIVLLIVGCIGKIVLKYRSGNSIRPRFHIFGIESGCTIRHAVPLQKLMLAQKQRFVDRKHCAFRVPSGSMPENTAWKDSPRFSGGYSNSTMPRLAPLQR